MEVMAASNVEESFRDEADQIWEDFEADIIDKDTRIVKHTDLIRRYEGRIDKDKARGIMVEVAKAHGTA